MQQQDVNPLEIKVSGSARDTASPKRRLAPAFGSVGILSPHGYGI